MGDFVDSEITNHELQILFTIDLHGRPVDTRLVISIRGRT